MLLKRNLCSLTAQMNSYAYQIRSKDKLFNTNHQQKIHELIGKINIIPQDIGRVILNLIINAFHAITEKNNIRRL